MSCVDIIYAMVTVMMHEYPNLRLYIDLDVPRAAKIGSEAVIALKVNVAVVSVHVLLLTGNVIQMFVGTVGSGEF